MEEKVYINGKPFKRDPSMRPGHEKVRATDYEALKGRPELTEHEGRKGLVMSVKGANGLRVAYFPKKLQDGPVPLEAFRDQTYEFEFLDSGCASHRRESVYKDKEAKFKNAEVAPSLHFDK